MRRKIDITGQRFGRLIAVREVQTEARGRYYLCRCDCGSEKIVRLDQLRSGKTKSCGCLNHERTSERRTDDLTGKQFGRLTVIGRSHTRHKTQGHVMWLCRCACGRTVEVLSKYLTGGETKSCGCWKAEHGHHLHQYNKLHLVKDGVFLPLLRSQVRKDNTTGVKGVSVNRENGKFRASIMIKRKRIYLGEYNNLAEAAGARKIAEEVYYRPYLERYAREEPAIGNGRM